MDKIDIVLACIDSLGIGPGLKHVEVKMTIALSDGIIHSMPRFRSWLARSSRRRTCEDYEIIFSVPSCDANEASYVSRHDERPAF